MTNKHLYILVLAIIAAVVSGQNNDIPIDENDNQFPPENPVEPKTSGDELEGSGDSTIEPLTPETEPTPKPQLEEGLATGFSALLDTNPKEDLQCPERCICRVEGSVDNYVVDCSGYELTEFPSPIDPRTTTLNIQNNKITEIPRDISILKNLKVLNAENNMIMDLASGSVSELPELTVLKLANNRLLQYPVDLKNGFGLTKLKELDLGGNDMRTELNPVNFENFKSLEKLTLAKSSSDLLQDVCALLKETLQSICTDTCEECPDSPLLLDEDDATLPAAISFENPGIPPEDRIDPIDNDNSDSTTENQVKVNGESSTSPADDTPTESSTPSSNTPLIASRSAITNDKEDAVPIKLNSLVVDAPKEDSTKTETDVKVGATTASDNKGGIDKSVIGMIVAGMVVVVAGITIKKNWSSIKRRFGSSSRTPPHDRGGANANGTAPEEVPLQDNQDKSPV